MAKIVPLHGDTDASDLTLASGDEVQLGGFTLTFSTDLSAIPLKITGTGTIHLTAGGYCNAATAALPATVSVVAGSPDSPLPFGSYSRRASAVLKLSGASNTPISSYTEEWNPPYLAYVSGINGTTVVFDRDLRLSAGDVLEWQNTASSSFSATEAVSSYDAPTHSAVLGSVSHLSVGMPVYVMSAPFYVENSAANMYCTLEGNNGDVSTNGYFRASANGLRARRLARGGSGTLIVNRSVADIDVLVAPLMQAPFGFSSTEHISCFSVNVGKLLGYSIASSANLHGGRLRIGERTTVLSSLGDIGVGTRVTMPPATISVGSNLGELRLLDKTETPPVDITYRNGGLTTLVQRDIIPTPTSLPDAWLLSPNEGGVAYVDCVARVPRRSTVRAVLYILAGADGASVGCDVIDASDEFAIAPTPDLWKKAVFQASEYSGLPSLAWTTRVVSWANDTDEDKVVILRVRAENQQSYVRIDPSTGGVA